MYFIYEHNYIKYNIIYTFVHNKIITYILICILKNNINIVYYIQIYNCNICVSTQYAIYSV